MVPLHPLRLLRRRSNPLFQHIFGLLRARLLTIFHLFVHTCSSPKNPTWNGQVHISWSIRYSTGRSCLFISPARFLPVGLSWQLKLMIHLACSTSLRLPRLCIDCAILPTQAIKQVEFHLHPPQKRGVLYIYPGGLFNQSDLNYNIFSKDYTHYVILTNLNYKSYSPCSTVFRLPVTLATTSGKRTAFTCSIYTPT